MVWMDFSLFEEGQQHCSTFQVLHLPTKSESYESKSKSTPIEDDFFTKYSGSSLANLSKPSVETNLNSSSRMKTVYSSPAMLSLKENSGEILKCEKSVFG